MIDTDNNHTAQYIRYASWIAIIGN